MYTNCVDCPHRTIENDPDPTDSFCSDDVAVLCKKAVNDNHKKRWYDNMEWPYKAITWSCRPHHIRKECSTPDWCPLLNEVKAECVCEGNWRNIIHECEDFIGKPYFDDNMDVWRFVGVLWAEDDFYYTFYSPDTRNYMFSTCVMSYDQTIKANNFKECRG